MELKDLTANPRNPRKISKKRREALKKQLETFGSLDGFVFNKATGRLASGHQRRDALVDGTIHSKELKEPDAQGTIAFGYVDCNGIKFPYREVSWSEDIEKAAMIAANNSAGEWNTVGLQGFLMDLDHNNFDLSLTGFTEAELENIMVPHGDKAKEPITCPKCGHEFES